MKPKAVVKHAAEEGLLGAFFRIAKATYAAAAFAACIQRERERGLVQESCRIVIVFDFDAVIAVIARTVRRSQRVLPQKI